MVSVVKNTLRRGLRALTRGGHFPLLLPHHKLTDRGIQTFDRSPEPIAPELHQALKLCDGSHSLASIARVSGASAHDLLALHEEEKIILWRSPVEAQPAFKQQPSAIIVSPHPDDAPLCLGGMMLGMQSGASMVLDIFTQTAWTRFPNELNDVARIQQVRTSEEQFMARLAGARLSILELPEALLRQHMLADVFTDAPSSWDQTVQAQLRSAISNIVSVYPSAVWYLPLAVGNHLDHRIVRDVTHAALLESIVPESRICFYEDLPYANTLGGVQDFSMVVPGKKLSPRSIDIDTNVAWKIELNRVYWSQFLRSQLDALGDYARRVGHGRAVERVWTLAR